MEPLHHNTPEEEVAALHELRYLKSMASFSQAMHVWANCIIAVAHPHAEEAQQLRDAATALIVATRELQSAQIERIVRIATETQIRAFDVEDVLMKIRQLHGEIELKMREIGGIDSTENQS